MSDIGMTVGLIKALGNPNPAVIESAVSDWLDDHPEATTTVEDGAISYAKLNSSLQGTVDDVSNLKTQITDKLDAPATPGTSGQVLTSDGQGGQSWQTPSGGDVTDVQVNGTSVVTNGVANIGKASDAQVKAGTETGKMIVPSVQDASAFFGLAKAAGDTTQSQSDNTVGMYTDDALVKIQKMLGIYEAPWELIREDTFTNATEANHEITVDGNGQAFELTDILMVLIVPTHNEDTTIGDYGRIYLYNNTNEIRRLYLLNTESKLVQANSVPQIATGRLLNNNGLMSIDFYPWTAQSNRASLQIIPRSESDGTMTAFAINTNYINKIKIGKITGQLQYRLFGKRKWD